MYGLTVGAREATATTALKADEVSMPTYHGGCHCGRVQFEVTTDLSEVIECNCSICTMKGFLHLIVEPERFRLISAPDAVTLYQFNTKTAKHYFCPVCGIHSYYIPRSHPNKIDVNVRCLEGVDLPSLTIRPFNGREWEKSRHTLDD
jgi:hypothetical protein